MLHLIKGRAVLLFLHAIKETNCATARLTVAGLEAEAAACRDITDEERIAEGTVAMRAHDAFAPAAIVEAFAIAATKGDDVVQVDGTACGLQSVVEIIGSLVAIATPRKVLRAAVDGFGNHLRRSIVTRTCRHLDGI